MHSLIEILSPLVNDPNFQDFMAPIFFDNISCVISRNYSSILPSYSMAFPTPYDCYFDPGSLINSNIQPVSCSNDPWNISNNFYKCHEFIDLYAEEGIQQHFLHNKTKWFCEFAMDQASGERFRKISKIFKPSSC